MGKITVKWLGHSCFRLTFGDRWAVIDPYRDKSVEGLGNIREEADAVFCSHSHHDHNAAELVKLSGRGLDGVKVIDVAAFHDNAGGSRRGENTIRVFEYRGMRLAHFGDLGHLLSDEQSERIGKLDLALLPVGGFFTVDGKTARQVAKQLGVKTVIPMHFRADTFGFGVLSTVDDFAKDFRPVTVADSSRITLDENTPRGTLILTPAMAGKE